MSDLPKVSVLIVTRNRRHLVGRAIESALAQTGVDLEVLVYDDASTDGTAAACQSFGEQVRVYRSEQAEGLLVLRNRGLRQAEGEFAFGLDDDAWFSSNDTLARAVELFRSDADIAAMGLSFLEPDRGQPCAGKALKHGEDVASFRGCAYGLRINAALQHGGFREELVLQGEERDLSIRLRSKGQRVVYCAGSPVIHLFSPAGRVEGPRCRPGARNNFLFEWWYAPAAILPLRLAAVTVNTLRYKVRLADIPARLKACATGLWGGWKYRRLRMPLTKGSYRQQRLLPRDAPDCLLGEVELSRKFPPVERGGERVREDALVG